MKRIRYLLGLCSPAEREQVESEYFESEYAFQEMLTAEDDLIDAYAHGELMGEECRAFQKNFVRSLYERDRVQFARAFARALSATRPVKTKLPRSVLYTFQSPGFLRAVTIASMIVIAAMFAWLVTDRRKMTNELRDLRAEVAELHKRTEALQNRDIEGPRTALLPEQPQSPREQPEKLMHRVRGTTATQRAGEKVFIVRDASLGNTITIGQTPVLGRKFEDLLSPPPGTLRSSGTSIRGIARDQNGNAVSGANVTLFDSRNFIRAQSTNKDGAYVFTAVPPDTYSIRVQAPGFKASLVSGLAALADTPIAVDIQLEVGSFSETVSVIAGADAPINTRDATIGNLFEQRRITELPLNANNVVGLLSLQPAVTSAGLVNGGRSDQAHITLDGVDVNERSPLMPWNISNSGKNNIYIPSSRSWIRFEIMLEKSLVREDYRVTIKTTDGHPVTSVDWSEPLTPNQTIIDTPFVSTGDLRSGNYVLLLLEKRSDHSFVKVAEYLFKVIKY